MKVRLGIVITLDSQIVNDLSEYDPLDIAESLTLDGFDMSPYHEAMPKVEHAVWLK